MLQPAKLEMLSQFCDILGMKFAIVASLPPEQMASTTTLLKMAATLNTAATTLKPAGVRIGCHPHKPDFQPVEGVIPWEIIFDHTEPEVVMQMDIGNALRCGVDPIRYLKKYPGRAKLVHLKEFSSQKPPAAIGDGEVDWVQVFEVCEELHQPEWYILEQEEKEYDTWESAEKSLKYLRNLGS